MGAPILEDEWTGADVSIAEIERELARLRYASAAETAQPNLRTSVMTHIAWAPPEWLGAAEESSVAECMDEMRPWVNGLAAFGAALVAARPDVGLAPLLDEPFNRAKSELHWIEYAMAGAPTVATAFGGPGPYNVIRDGEDGLLACSTRDWERHLRRLADSPGLRSELTGNARERVRADYSLAARATEWAEAYRWAAAHGGSGRGKASQGRPDPSTPAA